MKKISVLIIFFTFYTFAQSYDAIINLGGDCQVAYQLHIHGLRHYALPFDALITPYDALFNMLLHNFDGFLNADNFEFVIEENSIKYILDKKYGTRLLHDFKLQQDFLLDYLIIAEKYERRIHRLRNLIMETEYPLFIRKRITEQQAKELRDLILTLRQGRPFLLVALDGRDEVLLPWRLEFVNNYYLQQPKPYSWKGDEQAWREIFNILGLEISDPKEIVQ